MTNDISEFIKEFRLKCPDAWNIYIETSLNVPLQAVQAVEGIINGWIIAIKDMDYEIYTKYTGKGNELVISNLKYISSKRWSTPLKIRVPAIPNFNGYHDLRHSTDVLNSLGYNSEYIDEEFTYIQCHEDHYADKKTSGIDINEKCARMN